MKAKEHDTKGETVVFLKTYEEAKCADGVCDWTYSTPTPTVTKMTTEFDKDTASWLVKIEGTGLRDSADAGDMSDLQLNGKS
jgi:hypothetical protein